VISAARPGWHLALLVLSLTVAACGPSQGATAPTGDRPASGGAPERSGAPKRITVAALMDPPSVISKFESLLPGATDLEVLVDAGLAIPDDRGVLVPVLAEAVPTLDNGLWTLPPSGGMVTTWKLKQSLRWHDGAPFTADDLVFTGTVGRDPSLAYFRHPGYGLVDRIEATDPYTLVVTWKEPFVSADTLFSTTIDTSRITVPLPRHLLAEDYARDPQSLRQHPYWAEEFVGTGPFRLREWVQGSHVLLEAFDGFALGRPRVDQIEVRFVSSGSTLIANTLAGTVDASMGRDLSLDQTIDAERRWPEGKMLTGGPGAWYGIFPQFVNPDPAVIANPIFRRALMHALDRKEMSESLMYGKVPVAHIFMSPEAAGYKDVEAGIARYDYDPRRAAEMLQGLGYTLGTDGSLRGADGREVAVEMRTGLNDLYVKVTESAADQWRRAGLQVQTQVIPQTQVRNLEYRATRPGFELSRRGIGMENLALFHTRELPLPENNYIGKSVARYSSPEMDTLVDRYVSTVAPSARLQVQKEIFRHMSDQLPLMTLFYDVEPSLVSNRLVNLNGKPAESTVTWNAHLWDIR
jgi:peptide/nickel transport system substrate-binding protein